MSNVNKISNGMENILDFGRKIIPRKIFKSLQPYYHFCLSLLGAIVYRFPAKDMYVIAVTGTKGKTTTTEIMNAILEANGEKTVLSNTIKTKVVGEEERNLSKMTTRGRFFTQRLLRRALDKGAKFAVLEVSSEATLRFGHKFLFLDALIFTNLAPEHIESHGSYEKYVEAKLNIARELEGDSKQEKRFPSKSPRVSSLRSARLFSENFSPAPTIIVNTDDKESEKFLALNIANKIPYSLSDATGVKADENGSVFQVGKTVIRSKLPGLFNVSNMLGCIALAKFLEIEDDVIKKGLEGINTVRGRMEKINEGNPPVDGFDVIVDYAHTPDSLKAVYETYKNHNTICVLGNTGGGRDKWKRPEMGKIAGEYCNEIILTNEDPYDEDPQQIIDDMLAGIEEKSKTKIVLDRREAIRYALEKAASSKGNQKVAVLITGKGTDPYIMGPKGSKQKWDDAEVVREELSKLLAKN